MATIAQTAPTTRIIKASRETLAKTLAGRYRLTATEADGIIRAWIAAEDEQPTTERATILPSRT